MTETEKYNNAFEDGIKFEKKRTNILLDALDTVKQCLTSGNSVMVSDPRPALKYLEEGRKKYEEFKDGT